ncbi:Zinc finger protein [Plakobranchus ocellatus]|uniref:Zinc finger protein n=1 Tax=Plakobranchus ocellatus TaxID=259542 RepID=A0AAV3ZIB0_9GAST|nr:Zinc finger protein [Plakobranchus ocellatus]
MTILLENRPEQGLQVDVHQEDTSKTASVTMDRHYEFMRMPFGMLTSGPTVTLAEKDAGERDGLHGGLCDNHVRTLRDLFRRLQQVNFTVRTTKCVVE